MKLPWWKNALFSLLAIVLFFSALEFALYVFGVKAVLYEEDPYVGFSDRIPLFVAQPGTDILVTAKNKIRFFNPQQFARHKAPDSYRIFCVGGSTTYGRPYNDTTSFCGWLREFLIVADSSRDWEVINAGGISYASYRVAMLMEELIRYEPDLFIVYSGHNEFLERRTYSAILEIPLPVRGLGALLSRTRTYAVVKRALRRGPEDETSGGRDVLAGEVEALLDHTIGPSAYSRDDALRAQVVAHYRFNVARIVDIARSGGAEVVLVTPASNLRNCAPFKSEQRADLGVEERRRWQKLHGEAREAYKTNHLAGALRLLEEAAGIDDRDAHLHYLRARVLDALGRHDEARLAFSRARDEDIVPLRALSVMREILAEVAADRDVPLVDFMAIAEEKSKDGIPGENLFLDHVHPTIEGNRLLARFLLDELVRRQIARPTAAWNKAAVERVTKRVEGRVDRRAHGIALRNLAKVLGWAGKFEEARKLGLRAVRMVPHDSEAHFILGAAFERTDDLVEAATQYLRAVDLEPGYAEAHKNLGRVREKQGQLAAAAKHYKRALQIRPDFAKARANLGNVFARQGKLADAIVQLEWALRLEPENFVAHQKLGVVFFKQDNLAKAVFHLEEALHIWPDYARAHNNLGLVLADQWKVVEARGHYEEALRIQPDYASAHRNLGNLLAKQGKLVEAIAHFKSVFRLEPENGGVQEKLKIMASRFERVLESRSDDAEALYHLGLVLSAQGKTSDARDRLMSALAAARATKQTKLAVEIEKQLRD
ncbi:MAG: tetratricopeptide repeat protein [Deltaproteobacteria bacterium]|nr:tetratricopeptide repeat protein [Deltaproteobacteria bacterium]